MWEIPVSSMVEYNSGPMIYLDDDGAKIGERFRACFCPSRDLAHGMHPGHLSNMFIGDKLGKTKKSVIYNIIFW